MYTYGAIPQGKSPLRSKYHLPRDSIPRRSDNSDAALRVIKRATTYLSTTGGSQHRMPLPPHVPFARPPRYTRAARRATTPLVRKGSVTRPSSPEAARFPSPTAPTAVECLKAPNLFTAASVSSSPGEVASLNDWFARDDLKGTARALCPNDALSPASWGVCGAVVHPAPTAAPPLEL